MKVKALALGVISAVVALSASFPQVAAAADDPNGFFLQVSPSPLVSTLKPGTNTTLELKIRNAGTATEELKIESRQFSVNNQTGEVHLNDTAPSEIAPWVTYSAPIFTVQAGEWYTQKIHINLPKDTGFSYSLALVISRTKNPQATESGRLIKGSVAVFTLLNVDRPGAVRKVEVQDLSMSSNVYEYLPATVNVRFKNTGNTIVQPYGNIFIQRSSSDTTPISTLPVNDKKGYLLPGAERVLSTDWTTGFPTFQTMTTADGGTQKTENWDWSKVADFRIGQYTAKLVAAYNDGQRDVALEKETSFWVLPWKIIIGAVIALLLIAVGIWTFIRKIWSLVRRKKKHSTQKDA